MRGGSFPVFRTAVLLFIMWIVIIEFPGARDLIRSPYTGIETRNLVVQNIPAESPNARAAIERNDVIVSVDGTRVRNYNHLRYLINLNQEFAPQEYELRRGEETFTVTVRSIPITPSIVYRRFASLLVGFTFLLVGLIVLLRRDDIVGLLFSLNCGIFAFILTDRPIVSSWEFQLSGELFHDAVILLFPAVFMHFFLVFHDRPYREQRGARARLLVLLYSVPVLLFVGTAYLTVQRFFFKPTPAGIESIVLYVSGGFMAVYVIASLVIFVRHYRSSSQAHKQKKRVAMMGTVVGMLPFLFMMVWRLFSPGTNTLWEFLSVIALGFISISFGYAIIKHGAIELNIVVRKSLAYAFLSGVIIAAYYALVNQVGDFLMSEFHLKPAFLSITTILVLAVIFAPAREVVQRVVDRVLLRHDYDVNSEIVDFNRQLSRKLKQKEILDCFVERIERLLRPGYVAFYMRSESSGHWVKERVDGDAPELPEEFPKQSLLGRYLHRYGTPLMVEYLDDSWGRRHLDDTSTAFLSTSKAAVCLPLIGAETIVGMVVLGAKQTGYPYSQTDSGLLERFAAHLGLVVENAELHEASIEQERLKNEVLLAREIQLSLLPTESPHHHFLHIHGKMVSSVEVGGDYFDHFELEDDRIGVAIGDVSGKGVPAAMLMSSLQAVFKNLAVRDRMAPAELVRELNRHLCGRTKNNQFATFFYGILDAASSTFSFSNAGHCAGLLLKTNYADRLGEGGLPLGVDPHTTYEEGLVRIAPGDVVCLYTDGVTEQTNSKGEQFGEHRLLDFLGTGKNLPPKALIEGLFATVLSFGGGLQADDITAIIALHEGA